VILEHGKTWVGGDEFGYGRWQWWWWWWLRKWWTMS
jgi:hypothetical protein